MKLVISGLNELDAKEITELLKEDVEIAKPNVPEGSLAEPVSSIAIITISSLALASLSIFLSKARRKTMLTRSFRIIHADGRIEEFKLDLITYSEEAAKADEILEGFSKFLPNIE